MAGKIMQRTALSISHLGHSFGPQKVLDDISFELPKGDVVAVVGPSGGGKTTLLHLCAGMLEVEEGNIHNPFDRVAFAFQEPRLLPWQTARDNIAFGLKAAGVKKAERWKMAEDVALKFGLDMQALDKFPKDLSGGMRQRVSFARALITHPELFFLDEPFSALDIGLKQELQQILIEENRTHKLSILFITHDLMEAVRLSNQIVLLAGEPGRIVKRYHIDRPQHERNNHFVYETTANMLADPCIVETFGLGIHAD